MTPATIIVFVIVTVYLALCLFLGYLAYRKGVASTSDFFIAAGTISPIIIMATFVATEFSSYAFLGGSGLFFTNNIMPGLFELTVVVMSPISLIIALRIYKLSYYHNMVTPADFISSRFDSRLSVIFSMIVLGLVISIAFSLFYVSLQLTGSAWTLSGLTQGQIDYKTILIYFAIVMAVYTAMGGFRAVAYTDALQLAMCMVLLLTIAIIVLVKHGGLGNLFTAGIAARPEAYEYNTSKNYLGILTPLCLLGYLYFPHMLIRSYASKNIKGIMYMIAGCAIGGTVMLVIISTITGSAVSIFAPKGIEGVAPDQLIVYWCLEHLGPVVSALLLSGAIAASFSTADSILLLGASVIARDIFEKSLNIKLSSKKTMWVSRLFVVVMILTAFWGAMTPKRGLIDMAMSMSFNGYSMLVPLVVGCLWKRCNKWGMYAGFVVGLITAALLTFNIIPKPLGAYDQTWIIAFTGAAMIIVSLITPKPGYENSIEKFYRIK